MSLDLDQLRTLVAFAETGSVKGAARIVHKTSSAVSTHLSKLGDSVGRPLLVRRGRGLRLTADGAELVRYARRMLAVEREALAYFDGAKFRGTLRVGLPDDYIPIFMAPLLEALGEVAPHAQLEVQCAPSAELRPLLAAAELDLAILSAAVGSPEGVLLRRERVVWAGAEGFESGGADPLPLALFPEGCIFRDAALARLDAAELAHRVVCVSRSMPAIQAAVASGFAVSAIAESCVPNGARALAASSGLPELPAVDIVLVAPPGADPTLSRSLGDRIGAALGGDPGAP